MAVFLIVFGALLIFLAIAVVVLLSGDSLIRRQQVRRSMGTMTALTAPIEPTEALEAPFSERVVAPAVAKLSGWGRSISPADQPERVRRRLDLAGNPVNWDVDRVLGFKVVGLIGGALWGLLLGLVFGSALATILGLVLVSALLGYFGPDIALYQAGYNRTQEISRALPDALDLLTISVEAGMPFDSAVAQVATKTTGPLAEEFSRLLQEMQIGLGRTAAIKAMGARSDVPELRSFASAVVQADRLGIPVSNVLRIQAAEMRVKRSQRAEEAAQKVPVKILFPLIFCILPVLFIVILGPAVISIFKSLSG